LHSKVEFLEVKIRASGLVGDRSYVLTHVSGSVYAGVNKNEMMRSIAIGLGDLDSWFRDNINHYQ